MPYGNGPYATVPYAGGPESTPTPPPTPIIFLLAGEYVRTLIATVYRRSCVAVAYRRTVRAS